MNLRLLLTQAATGLALAAAPAIAQPEGVVGYEVSIIAPLNGHRSTNAAAVDDLGRVVGRSSPNSGAPTPISWVNGVLTALPTPDGHHNPVVTNISPSTGLIVGYALDPNSIEQATVWSITGGVTTLFNLPDTIGGLAMAVEDTPYPMSRIVGRCAAFGPDYAVLWINEHVIDIGGISSAATDVNKIGDVVGTWTNGLGARRPVLWHQSERIDLGGDPLNASGDAYAMNDFSDVVGQMGGFGPFLWRDGQRLALSAPSDCWTIPHDINNAGLIVGEFSIDSQCRAGYEHALLWVPREGGLYDAVDLNDLNAQHPEIELKQAWNVNYAGQIAAVGKLGDGSRRGVLLTPYHFSISAPMPGGSGQRNTVTVSGLDPDQVVALLWGLADGARPLPGGCAGGTVLLRLPQMIATARADSQGQAEFSLMVPQGARGMTVRFQAVSPARCEVSHVVVHTFD